MAWSAKFNFRSTTAGPGAGVTDGAGEVKVISGSDTAAGVGEVYPVSRSNGTDTLVFGWTSPSVDTRDRSATPGAQFAGTHFNGLNLNTFQVDLPETGEYDIKIAAGDYNNACATNKWEIFDDASSLIVSTTATSTADRFVAQDTNEYASASWGAVAAVRKTFATTTFYLKIGNNAATATGFVAHLEITRVASSTPVSMFGGN